jgi:hexosaminidase
MRMLVIMLTLAAWVYCTSPAHAEDLSIIPRPEHVQIGGGSFRFSNAVILQADGPEATDAAQFLAQTLQSGTGMNLAIKSSSDAASGVGAVLLTTASANHSLGDEGYELEITPKGVAIRATHGAGLFYGVQTLLQLMPPAVYGHSAPSGAEWVVPAVTIRDQPRFRWRGVMLDVSRHFVPKDAIFRYLDLLAMHKLNVFHWHLTDDQGWRIEIKKYPRLTEVGAWRNSAGFKLDNKYSTTYGPDGRYGGFYSQDDVREVVRYAGRLHITIVPEIEMPGHATAALAAYPELSTSGGPFPIEPVAGIFHGVYCAGNEQTFTFLQDVLTEVMDLFPSPYIHIGGDEVPEDSWNDPKDQKLIVDQKLAGPKVVETYLVNRISRFIHSHGRKLVGWDEILNPDLAPDATVMSWRGTKNGAEAARAGHDVVMSPSHFCYLDGEQATVTEPLHLRGWTMPLERVYGFDPVKELSPEQASHILGVQANLWTEYVPNFESVQYMTWPRAAAIAEVGWSAASPRDFNDFKRRIKVDESRLDACQTDYRPIEEDELQRVVTASKDNASKIQIEPAIPGAEIHYTLDGSFPTRESPLYSGPFEAPKDCKDIKVGYFRIDSVAVIVADAPLENGRFVQPDKH